jgi:hypothetical protein
MPCSFLGLVLRSGKNLEGKISKQDPEPERRLRQDQCWNGKERGVMLTLGPPIGSSLGTRQSLGARRLVGGVVGGLVSGLATKGPCY